MTTSSNRAYLPEIEHVRAFAALLVFFYHGLQVIGVRLVHGPDAAPSQFWLHPANPIITLIQEGHTGVSLFVVLSGFILSIGAIGNAIDYKRFLLARILRIYPMLIVCLLAALCVSPSSTILN